MINEILPEKSMVGWEQIKIIRKGQYRPGATCCAFISVKSENDQLLLVRELHDAYEQRLTDQRLRCEKAVPREASAQPEIQAAGEANAEPEIQTAGTEANAEPEIQTAGPQANAKPEMETAAEATRSRSSSESSRSRSRSTWSRTKSHASKSRHRSESSGSKRSSRSRSKRPSRSLSPTSPAGTESGNTD